MKKLLLPLFILLINLLSCQNPDPYQELRAKLVDFLVEKEMLTVEEYNNEPRILHLRGLFKDKLNNLEVKNGIYSFSINRTHTKAFFVIVENNNYDILDLTSTEGFIESIKKTLIFCKKNNYCKELTIDYINRIIGVYYIINKNPNTRIDPNCKFPKNLEESTYSLDRLSNQLAEYLVKVKDFESMDFYSLNPEYLVIDNFSMYYDLPISNKFIESGVYKFYNGAKDDSLHYAIVNIDSIVIHSIKNDEQLYETLSAIITFYEDKEVCYKIIKEIVNEIIEENIKKTCLILPIDELP